MNHHLYAKKNIANWQRKTGSASRSIHHTLKRNDNNKRVQYLIHRHSLQPAKFQCYSVTNGSERGKNRRKKGTERGEWQAYPGSYATSSQILMFFAQSISLSLSLVAAFTISAAIFSPRLLHSITPPPFTREQIQARIRQRRARRNPCLLQRSHSERKDRAFEHKPQPASKERSILPEPKERGEGDAIWSYKITSAGAESEGRGSAHEPRSAAGAPATRRAASGFWLATVVARPWRRRHAQ